MNWSEHFKTHIETYVEPINFETYLNKDTIDNIKNTINKNKDKKCFTLDNIKLSTNFITKNNINIKYSSTDYNKSQMIILGNSSDIFFNFKEKLEKEVFNHELHLPKNKFFANKNVKINNIDFSKLTYFINYFNKEQQREYIKFTPDFDKTDEIKKMLISTEIKLLCEIVLYNLNVDYDYKLSKYPYIKKAFDIRYFKMKKERQELEKKVKDDRIIIDSKFNKFKFNKEKLQNSNNKILELLHAL